MEHDQEHTTSITNQGLYCYKVMPFSLKTTGATYQRLVNHMFKPLIGKPIEMYVGDMITKSIKPKLHVSDLRVTFHILLQFQMR